MKVTELREELEARGLNTKGLKVQLQERLQESIDQEKENESSKMDVNEEASQDTETSTSDETGAGQEVPEKQAEEGKGDDGGLMVVDEAKDDSESKDSEITFVKPKPVEDNKAKHAITAAYKFPSKNHIHSKWLYLIIINCIAEEHCILIHPNTKYKSGKFDCSVMSLSVLLDYRIDDNKEGTFEVSLFAEVFNEMLMRDSSFKIYKAIVQAPEKDKTEKKDKKEAKEKVQNIK